jgi:hypothetical protein
VSRWPYLRESLGDAGIPYADDDQLVDVLQGLSPDDLAHAAAASVALRSRLGWERLAQALLDAVIAVGAIKC